MLTQERLKELLHYNPDTGIFTRISPKRGSKIGSVGCHDKDGYLRCTIDYKNYKLHRLAWFYMFGVWPDIIDHINGIKPDNRIANLRDVTIQINTQNQTKPMTDNKIGFLGVRLMEGRKKPSASITVNGKIIHLGYFNTAQEAHAAYVTAKRQLHEGNTL